MTERTPTSTPIQQLRQAFQRGDADAVRRILSQHAEFRASINAPVFAFNAPAIVAYANNLAMLDVLLEFGADPNARSAWWAGAFHALHMATGAAAARLLAAGAIPDACAAAHLDDADLLSTMIATNAACVHERGGDGQTPLHFARSRRVVDLLLDAGADIDARDVDHRATPAEWMLDRARDAGRYALAQYLVERGAHADIFMTAALGLTDRAVALLQRDTTLLDEMTGRGRYAEMPPSSFHMYFWTIGSNRSPLEVAAQFGHDDTLSAMLAFATPMQRLRLACRRSDGEGARAVLREHPELMTTLTPNDHRAVTDAAWNGDAPAVALMLTLGFDPATPGHDAGTALHCAAWQGSGDSVATILAHPAGRALLTTRDAHHSATPLGWCRHGSLHGPASGEHARIAQLLLEAGAPLDEGEASDAVEEVLEQWRAAHG